MIYDIIGGSQTQEKIYYYSIDELIELAKKYSAKVFRFSETDFYPEQLESWRGSYSTPSLTYSETKIVGADLSVVLTDGLEHTHTGYKGGEYAYHGGMSFYVANYGSSAKHKVVGYENKEFEIVLLTKMTRIN